MVQRILAIFMLVVSVLVISEENGFGSLLYEVTTEHEEKKANLKAVALEMQKGNPYLNELRELVKSNSQDMERKKYLLSKVKEMNDRQENAIKQMQASNTKIFSLIAAVSEYCGEQALSSHINKSEYASDEEFLASYTGFKKQVQTMRINCGTINFDALSTLLNFK